MYKITSCNISIVHKSTLCKWFHLLIIDNRNSAVSSISLSCYYQFMSITLPAAWVAKYMTNINTIKCDIMYHQIFYKLSNLYDIIINRIIVKNHLCNVKWFKNFHMVREFHE